MTRRLSAKKEKIHHPHHQTAGMKNNPLRRLKRSLKKMKRKINLTDYKGPSNIRRCRD
jgi:hypothetical protein